MKFNKLIICLAIFLVQTSFLIAGTGTANDPFTVAEAIKKKNTTQVFFVKGYIIGEMKEFSNNKYFYNMAPPFDGTTAYLIADKADELDLSKCMPIQSGSTNGDLEDNPEFWRKPVLVSGYLKDYFGMPGIKDLASFSIQASEPLFDEAQYWNFMEDFDEKKAYTPRSTEYTFAGGHYEGYDMPWDFVGSTLGDTGKDQKWERAAARIRLTDGPTGSPGHIETLESFPNGIGYVRMWAGNYEEDTSGGSLALYVSSNNGSTWEKVAHSQAITTKWIEYEFVVKRQGNLLLRIAKDENSSKGINVDNIRVSDFYEQYNGVDLQDKDALSYYTTAKGLHIDPKNRIVSLKVFSITGQQVFSANMISTPTTIPLPIGTYVLKINKENRAHKVCVM